MREHYLLEAVPDKVCVQPGMHSAKNRFLRKRSGSRSIQVAALS